jgi:hypothetical protein
MQFIWINVQFGCKINPAQEILQFGIHCQQVKKGERCRRQRADKFYPQDTPFLTLLPLAPKVFAKQKRFSATPTFFLQAVESLNVDIGLKFINSLKTRKPPNSVRHSA